MNVKRLERLFKCLSLLFKFLVIMTVLGMLGVVILVIAMVWKKDVTELHMTTLSSTTFFSFTSGRISAQAKNIAIISYIVPMLLGCFYIFTKASLFFRQLAKGETPFSMVNYNVLKKIALVTIFLDIVPYLLYSLVLTLIMPNGYYFALGSGDNLFIGLIIYCMAEIIKYGISLQDLSDETV